MTRIEIATRILCSKNCTETEAWIMSGNLMELADKVNQDAKERYNQMRIGEIDLQNVGDLSKRTAERTQQLIDFGFEADEDLIFVKGEVSISPKLIGEYNEKEWGYFLETVVDEGDYDESILPIIKPTEKTPEELMQLMRNQPLQFVPNDFFKGNPYIEFEMPNTTLRLYRMEKQQEAENDLQVTKSKESKYIMTHSENKEFELGFTIFKK